MEFTMHPKTPHTPNEKRAGRLARKSLALFLGVVAATLYGCGGGGGGGSDTGPGTGGGGGVDVAALAGTYTLKAGSAVVGSFMMDKSASVTVCAIDKSATCAAEVTPPATAGAGTSFKLKGDENSKVASGTIAADGAVTGQLAVAGSPAQALTGSKTSANFADCEEPFKRVNGQCVPPSSGVVISPTILWHETLSQGGRTYVMQLCHGQVSCTAISPEIFVSNQDLADSETPPILAYAFSVAKEFQSMIARFAAAKTFPTTAQLVQIFRNATSLAISTETPVAVETAGAAFVAAGFPAATGGQSSGPIGTADTAESVCAQQTYPGDTSEVQVYLFDKIAQLDACLYKATNNANYVTDGNRQCRVLDGTVKSTVSTFKPLFCNGPLLKY